MEKELFSVIVLHYNQPAYVINAIDSVLKQNYERIELIFADDASVDIDLNHIKKYISENKGENIENVLYMINEENQGTVKTVNDSIKAASGKYVLFFAADDALYDKKVISNFCDAFAKTDESVYMVSSQCHMMDEELKESLEVFVPHTQAVSFNKMSAYEQFRVFASDCFLAIGATAMRKDMFEKFGYFNEEYKYIEDWSYFLHLTRSGGLIRYFDFDGLLHRDGGISHFLAYNALPPHVLQYKLDTLRICENEIFPYYQGFSYREKLKVFHKYIDEKRAYCNGGGSERTMSELQMIRVLPKYYFHLIIGPFLKGWIPLINSVRISAYIAFFAVALAICRIAFGLNFLSYQFVNLIAFATCMSIGITVIILLMSLGIKFLGAIKKFFKG